MPAARTGPLDAIVIGGGIDGLATAAYLGRARRSVLVLERRDLLGGSAATEELAPGFRVDGCRLDPGWVPQRVIDDLELGRHGLEIATAPTSVFALACDAPPLVISRDPRTTAESIRAGSPADAGRWEEFAAFVTRLAGFLEALYSSPAPDVDASGAADLVSLLSLGRRLRGLGKAGMLDVIRTIPMSIADLLDEWFEGERLKGALAAGGIAELLQGPRSGGTAFLFLHRHVGAPGVIRPHRIVRRGIGSVAAAVAGAARQHGVEVRTGTEVARIIVRDGRATGVQLVSGEEIAARVVISSADPVRTLDGLIDPVALDPEVAREVRNIKLRGASARVHLVLGELPHFGGRVSTAGEARQLLSGVISVAPSMDDLERAYDDAKHGGVSRRPLLEAVIPTVHDPSLAPAGRHIMSVRVQFAPYHLRDGAWSDDRREALGDLVVDALAEHAPNLRAAITDRWVFTPADLEARYALTEGSVTHGEMTLDQILFMRPVAGYSRYRAPVDGLYVCGSGTHPGGGHSGASASLAAREILRDLGRRRAVP